VYKLEKRELAFWELCTSGVEIQTGPNFNIWALGPVLEGFVCPQCQALIEPGNSDFADAITAASDWWRTATAAAHVACPECKAASHIRNWQSKPPLAFGNLAITFWNWPPFNLRNWKIDIPNLVNEVTGHRIVTTYGHL
jgi:hypothetical protein